MSDAKFPPEPSMEEILASIRRILAEDERSARPAPRLERSADILDLTEAIGEDGTVRHIEPAVMRLNVAAPPPLPDGRVEPAVSPSAGAKDRLVSAPAADAVTASFTRLAGLPHQGERPGERAIDAAVRETLRPMLQAWLDDHLPALVERLVQAEIARLVGDAAKR
jgi:uncharacterized protein